MNAADLATEGLLSQEIESLAGCIARGQEPDTYQDIVEKIRGHASKLPKERAEFWAQQCHTLGVTLFPPLKNPTFEKGTAGWEDSPKKPSKSTKTGGTSVP